MGIEGDAGGGDGDYGESGTICQDCLDLDLSGRDACGNLEDASKVGGALMVLAKMLSQLQPFGC